MRRSPRLTPPAASKRGRRSSASLATRKRMTLVGAGHVAPLLRALVLLIMAASAGAQSLEERLDEELFVRELSDLGLGRLVEHYGTMRPPSPTLNHRIRIARHRIGALDPGRA